MATFIRLESDFKGVKLVARVHGAQVRPVHWPELLRTRLNRALTSDNSPNANHTDRARFRSESFGQIITQVAMSAFQSGVAKPTTFPSICTW